MQDDHVAVGEVVLGGEGVGRIDPDGGEKRGGGEGREQPPVAEMMAPEGDADEEDEREHRKEIACEQSSAKYGEGDPVGEQNDGESFQRGFANVGRSGGRGDGNEQNGDGAEHGHEHVHVGGEVEQTMPKREPDAIESEIGGGVVAEKFRVAEDEAGVAVVIDVPEDERDGGEEEGSGPAEMLLDFCWITEELEGLPKCEGCGGDDCRLF